ncbi:MAG: hypothetical protein KDK03_09830 [Rhodobacteraceae bacterium]|nr:hypothetical protein [Paracoccaceae bacterium]
MKFVFPRLGLRVPFLLLDGVLLAVKHLQLDHPEKLVEVHAWVPLIEMKARIGLSDVAGLCSILCHHRFFSISAAILLDFRGLLSGLTKRGLSRVSMFSTP